MSSFNLMDETGFSMHGSKMANNRFARINKLEAERNHKHHKRAQWRQGDPEDAEQFYRNQWNSKLNCWKSDIFVQLCKQMNIDQESLMPKQITDFPVNGHVDPMISEARY